MGFVFGLSLLVLLPSSIEALTPRHPARHVLLVFASAPLLMYFFHHVVLDHHQRRTGLQLEGAPSAMVEGHGGGD